MGPLCISNILSLTETSVEMRLFGHINGNFCIKGNNISIKRLAFIVFSLFFHYTFAFNLLSCEWYRRDYI